jgi:hypothetical protein
VRARHIDDPSASASRSLDLRCWPAAIPGATDARGVADDGRRRQSVYSSGIADEGFDLYCTMARRSMPA